MPIACGPAVIIRMQTGVSFMPTMLRLRLLRLAYHASAIAAIGFAVNRVANANVDARAMVSAFVGSLLLFAGLNLRVHDPRRSASGTSLSMHSAVAMALLYVIGPWTTVVAAIGASLGYDTWRGRPVQRRIGNLTTRIVPVALAGMTWSVTGGRGDLHLPDHYLPLVASALVFALSNELCFVWDSMTSGVTGARWRDERERLFPNLQTTALSCLVGAGVAVICMENPWTAPVVLPLTASLYLAMERRKRVQQVTERALDTFANIVDERDRYTFEHSDRVCDYSLRIGRRMQLSEQQLEALYWTSRLHDLGKVAVDNSILNKPGRLTEEEFEVMKVHPIVSARILASFSFDEYDADVVLCHHERFDGRGYLHRDPDSVPLESFIIAVADAFDAMTSDRPYRQALSHDVALTEIAAKLGTQFHPQAGAEFLLEMGWSAAEIAAGHRADANVDAARAGLRLVDAGDDVRDVA